MSRTSIIIISGVMVLLAGAALGSVFVGDDGTFDGDRRGLEELGGGYIGPYEESAATITRTADGYEPKEVTINIGEAVSFKNESGEHHWPASDIHPTHGLYSEFDPRAPVAPGDTWTFVFEEPGEWEFHDHLRANKKGTITVVE